MLRRMIKGTPTSFLIEFAYYQSFHSPIGISPFKACYGFKPLFPSTMIPLSSHVVVSLDAKQRAREMMNIHSKVNEVIDKNNSEVANQ